MSIAWLLSGSFLELLLEFELGENELIEFADESKLFFVPFLLTGLELTCFCCCFFGLKSPLFGRMFFSDFSSEKKFY
jgi:hypothetical protein